MTGGVQESQEAEREWRSPALIGAWVALTGVVLVLSLHRYDSFQLGTYRDDAYYALLARALVFTDSYALHHTPGPSEPVKYPFGFPLLLTVAVRLWPEQPDAGRVISLLATLTNVSLLFWGWPLIAQKVSRWHALAIAALYGLSPFVLGFSRMVMSEAIFTTFTLTALLFAEHCARRGPRRWSVLGLGMAIAGCLFTRVAGFIILPALALRFALPQARPHALPVLGGALLVVIGVVSSIVAFTPVRAADLLPQGYVREIGNRWTRGSQDRVTGTQRSRAERFVRYAATPAAEGLHALLVPIGGGGREAALGRRLGLEALPRVIDVVLATVVLIGVWETLRSLRLTATILIFELMYIASLLVWSRPDARLLYPIQPILAYQLLLGIAWLLRQVIGSPRAVALCVAGIWAVLASVSAYKSAQVTDSRRFVRDFRVGSHWLRAHSASDAVVMTDEPVIIHLYAERLTVNVPAVHSADDLVRSIDEQDVDYVLIGPELEWESHGRLWYDDDKKSLLQLLTDLVQRGRADVVYESPPDQVRIYRVTSGRVGAGPTQ